MNILLKGFAASVLLFLALASMSAYSATVTYGFQKITSNNVEDISSQLSITILDSTEANSTYGLSLLNSEVLFTAHNDVGISSSIAEVYIDDGLLGPSVAINSLGGFTDFSGGGAKPSNLPGGSNVGFNATTLFSADVNPGPTANGVNESSDILGVRLGLGSFQDLSAIAYAVENGDLSFGYHIRSIGVAGGSDSYTNTLVPVPIPAAFWLFSSGLIGLFSLNRSRKNGVRSFLATQAPSF